MNVSRRSLLRMLGLAGASYFAPLGGRRIGLGSARAADPPIPRRIVFFYTEQGTFKPTWAPSAPGAPDAKTITTPWSTTQHTLGNLHVPLVPLKDKLIFLDGLDMSSTYVDPTGGANGHINGETHALTAAFRQTASLAGGPSIDQYIAQKINAPSPVTRLPSLELFVDANGGDNGGEQHPLYAGAGQPLPLHGSLGGAYDRLFPNGPQGASPEAVAAQARILAGRKKVLGVTNAEFSSVASKLSKLDRERLEAHGAAVADLAARLGKGPAATCTEPPRSIITTGTGATEYEKNADVMMRLAQTALACDLTRVVTLYMNVPPDDAFGYQSVEGTTDFHDMIHRTQGASPALDQNQAAMDIVRRFHNLHAQKFADFINLLSAIPEADGGTLLDHTLVVWCGQLAGGDHSVDQLPYVLAGGMGGAVTPGRYVRYPRIPDPAFWPAYSHGPAHNDLFVALANMMGVNTSTFGEASVCKGPLGGLK